MLAQKSFQSAFRKVGLSWSVDQCLVEVVVSRDFDVRALQNVLHHASDHKDTGQEM